MCEREVPKEQKQYIIENNSDVEAVDGIIDEVISEELSKMIDEHIANYTAHFADIRYDLFSSNTKEREK